MFGWIKKLFAPTPTVVVDVEDLSVVEPDVVVEVAVEEPQSLHTRESLSKLTKVKLEELGKEHGVDLDRRKRKDTLIDELLEVLK